MKALKRTVSLAFAVTLLLALALPLQAAAAPDGAPEASSAPAEPSPSASGATDPSGVSSMDPIWGPYTTMWVSLLIGVVCIVLAVAIFCFTGRS